MASDLGVANQSAAAVAEVLKQRGLALLGIGKGKDIGKGKGEDKGKGASRARARARTRTLMTTPTRRALGPRP